MSGEHIYIYIYIFSLRIGSLHTSIGLYWPHARACSCMIDQNINPMKNLYIDYRKAFYAKLFVVIALRTDDVSIHVCPYRHRIGIGIECELLSRVSQKTAFKKRWIYKGK